MWAWRLFGTVIQHSSMKRRMSRSDSNVEILMQAVLIKKVVLSPVLSLTLHLLRSSSLVRTNTSSPCAWGRAAARSLYSCSRLQAPVCQTQSIRRCPLSSAGAHATFVAIRSMAVCIRTVLPRLRKLYY